MVSTRALKKPYEKITFISPIENVCQKLNVIDNKKAQYIRQYWNRHLFNYSDSNLEARENMFYLQDHDIDNDFGLPIFCLWGHTEDLNQDLHEIMNEKYSQQFNRRMHKESAKLYTPLSRKKIRYQTDLGKTKKTSAYCSLNGTLMTEIGQVLRNEQYDVDLQFNIPSSACLPFLNPEDEIADMFPIVKNYIRYKRFTPYQDKDTQVRYQINIPDGTSMGTLDIDTNLMINILDFDRMHKDEKKRNRLHIPVGTMKKPLLKEKNANTYYVPIGFTPIVEEVFADYFNTYKIDAKVKTKDNRTKPEAKIDTPLRLIYGDKKREYQTEAKKEIIKKKKGIVNIATGGGKTYIATSVIANLGTDVVFLVPNNTILENAKTQIPNTIIKEDRKHINVNTISGDDKEFTIDEKKVNIHLLSLPLAARYIASNSEDGEIQTDEQIELKRNLTKILEESPILIVDEAHHIAADKFEDVAKASHAYYRIGLTATPYRQDERMNLKLAQYIGPELKDISMSARDLIEKGVLATPSITRLRMNTIATNPTTTKKTFDANDIDKRVLHNYRSEYCKPIRNPDNLFEDFIFNSNEIQFLASKTEEESEKYTPLNNRYLKYKQKHRGKGGFQPARIYEKGGVECNQQRNEKIQELSEKLQSKQKNHIVVTRHINHAELLDKTFENYPHAIVTGTKSILRESPSSFVPMEREKIFEQMRERKLNTLIATEGVIGEGLDIPNLDALIIANATASKVKTVQLIGRTLRKKKDEVKTAKIYDFYDENLPYLRKRQYKRAQIWANEKYTEKKYIKEEKLPIK